MKNKKILIIVISITIFLILSAVTVILLKGQFGEYELVEIKESAYRYEYIDDYYNYKEFTKESDEFNKELSIGDFKNKKYLVYNTSIDSCGGKIVKNRIKKEDNKYKLYFDEKTNCGACAPLHLTYVYEVDEILEVEVYYRDLSNTDCRFDTMVKKPMIYIYPEEDMDLTIKLGNTKDLLYTYPKYKNEWNVRVSKDGNIYDYYTDRNYYGLYWEGNNNYKLNMDEGFVVKGEDSIKFLEEKLEILGLNGYEINEFIVYWIDKLESNKYNFISFRNPKDINMPLVFSKEPDTLIRVMMDFKGLDRPIKIKEQNLNRVERIGYTVVEWGGTYHN